MLFYSALDNLYISYWRLWMRKINNKHFRCKAHFSVYNYFHNFKIHVYPVKIVNQLVDRNL